MESPAIDSERGRSPFTSAGRIPADGSWPLRHLAHRGIRPTPRPVPWLVLARRRRLKPDPRATPRAVRPQLSEKNGFPWFSRTASRTRYANTVGHTPAPRQLMKVAKRRTPSDGFQLMSHVTRRRRCNAGQTSSLRSIAIERIRVRFNSCLDIWRPALNR